MRDQDGWPTGVVPLIKMQIDLRLNFKFLKWDIPLQVAQVLGDQPLLMDEADKYDLLLSYLIDNLKDIDAICLRRLDLRSFCWRYIRESPVIRDTFLLHIPETSAHHVVELPYSFETYLAQFGAKHRNNLKRRARILREHAGGALELRRVTTREDVPEFLRMASEVARRRGRTIASMRMTRSAKRPPGSVIWPTWRTVACSAAIS